MENYLNIVHTDFLANVRMLKFGSELRYGIRSPNVRTPVDIPNFYRYINSQKKDTQGIPPLKKRNGSGIAQSEFEKAEEFNGQFSDVFTKSEYKQVPLMDRSAPFMHDIVVTKEGVTKLLKGLNPSKALGPDELHPRVLKKLAVELGPVFTHLFQQSIDTNS